MNMTLPIAPVKPKMPSTVIHAGDDRQPKASSNASPALQAHMWIRSQQRRASSGTRCATADPTTPPAPDAASTRAMAVSGNWRS